MKVQIRNTHSISRAWGSIWRIVTTRYTFVARITELTAIDVGIGQYEIGLFSPSMACEAFPALALIFTV